MDARLAEMAREFVRLGLTAFGGPAAHIAIMQRELVERRGWVAQERFVDLIGLSSLLPGPSSTEVALGIGFERAHWRGLGIAALGFIMPASLIVLAIAIVYGQVGSVGEVRYLLYGMSPVVIAVIAQAMLTLAPTAFTDAATWLVGIGAFVLSLIVLQPIAIVVAGALVLLVVRRAPDVMARTGGAPALVSVPFDGVSQVGVVAGAVATLGLAPIFLTFLKLGVVVFGSGYVLIAFLGAELVEPGHITEQQLLDAIAIGQLTPGPVFTTATFVGYLLAGVPGAILATLGIFLPAIVLVGVVHPWLDRIRANATLSAAMEGLNAAAIGLIGFSVVLLGEAAFLPDGALDPIAAALGLGAFAVLVSGWAGPVPLLVGGALIGFLSRVVQAA